MSASASKKVLITSEITFPNAPRNARKKSEFFSKFLSLIEENKEDLPITIESRKRGKLVILDSKNFLYIIRFGTAGKVIAINANINVTEEILGIANEIGNKVINYLNIILGDGAKKAKVYSNKTIDYPDEIPNLSRRIIGDIKISKINEKVKQSIEPIGTFFEYKIDDRTYAMFTLSDGRKSELFITHTTFKNRLPFDWIKNEYEELNGPTNILEKIKEMEFS